jgi:hypothetical protein
MMNNILFTKKKQQQKKNIYRKCSHILLVSKTSPLVGFKYHKGYDWLDSKFHCSYLESREIPEKHATKTRLK